MAMEALDWRSMVVSPDQARHWEHQRIMQEQAIYSQHGQLPVKCQELPAHQAYALHIGRRILIVPYRLLEYPGTTVVVDNMDPYSMLPVYAKSETKPKEKIDLCSTHIYTRK